jgi:hypothetical protein
MFDTYKQNGKHAVQFACYLIWTLWKPVRAHNLQQQNTHTITIKYTT